ncbi:MAG: orotidine-5'-phosphate decarboxylase [Phycisphaeraceae bacterium]
MASFADRLMLAVERTGSPVCVGLDPVLERLPVRADDPIDAVRTFCMGVLDGVAGVAAAVKPQSACFERYGWRGVRLLEEVLAGARERGLLTINDAKRGDIAISATHYAEALLGAGSHADALTVNGYLGADTLSPFVEVAAREGAGLFVLVRTSNPGSDEVQGERLVSGGTVAEHLARMVDRLGAEHVSSASGLSLLGAVVGATKVEDAEALRGLMPRQVFLLPGYGAQGGDASSLRRYATVEGRGVLVTASRSVIYAGEGADWVAGVHGAAERMRDEVGAALG